MFDSEAYMPYIDNDEYQVYDKAKLKEKLNSRISVKGTIMESEAGFDSLHLAAWRGHTAVVTVCLQQDLQAVDLVDSHGYTALMYAAERGHRGVVRLLHDHGAALDHQDCYKGDTGLHLAAGAGHLDTVCDLLLMGASPWLQNKRGLTAEMVAKVNNNPEVVIVLKSWQSPAAGARNMRGAAVDGKEALVGALSTIGVKRKLTTEQISEQMALNIKLNEAAKSADTMSVSRLIEEGADMEFIMSGKSAFHLAAEKGDDEMLEMFLQKNPCIDVNMKGEDNKTPMMYASQWGHRDTLKLLKKHGAMLDVQDRNGWTALTFAARYGHRETVAELLVMGASTGILGQLWGYGGNEHVTPIQVARMHGMAETVKIMESWNKPEVANENLLEAAHNGNFRLVSGLLIIGADVQHRNVMNNTGLHLAADRGHTKVVNQFLGHGMDVNIGGRWDSTPLMYAAQNGHHTCVSTFLNQQGVLIDLQNNLGKSALMYAAKRGKLGIVCELLERGANTGLKDGSEKTALSWAQEKDHSVIDLVMNNEDIGSKDVNGGNALLAATENGNINVVTNLLERGANMDFQNESGETPLQVAARRENHAIIKKFLSHDIADHDPDSITKRVDNIAKYHRSNHYGGADLYGREKFFQKKKDNVSLLDTIVNQSFVKEREQILDIITDIDKEQFGDDNPEQSEYRVTNEVKQAMPSSVGLRKCIKSVEYRYPWSFEMMIVMMLLSIFVNIIMGTGFYAFDIGTDFIFSWHMFKQSYRNFTLEIDQCKDNFDSKFNEAISFCRYEFKPSDCLKSLRIATKNGENCFENEQRFEEDPRNWWVAGVISVVHCASPIFFSWIFWYILEAARCNRLSFFKLPLPFITKFYKCYCECQLYYLNTHKNRKESEEMKKQYQLKVQKCIQRLKQNANTVNFSMIIEAAMESSFQFFFQTVYMMPTLILSLTDDSTHLTELFNWRLFSIFISFATFAWTFYSIR